MEIQICIKEPNNLNIINSFNLPNFILVQQPVKKKTFSGIIYYKNQ